MPFINATIGSLLATLMDLIFNIVAWITAQIGYLLDFVVQEMVLNMADLVNEIGAIDSLWQIFRDLGNIVFIGVLLYIAIRTILDVGNSFNTKRLLTRLVIVALFVNFSLFATKVIIDTSNVVALQFYNSIQVEDCGEGTECNISHFFADATNISSVQSAESIDDEAAVEEANNSNFRIALARVLGIIFLLVTAFVMGAMAFLLIIRFAVLMLLMIASPLAFIAFILPSAGSWGKKWFDKLLNQSFFAPALFAMIYVVANLAAELQSGIAGDGDGSTDLMAAVLSPDAGENFGVLLVFFLMIILMASTLVVAKSMGAAGASKTIEIGQKARNWGQAAVVGGTVGAAAWAGRQSLGRGAQQISESSTLKQKAAQGGIGGWAARQSLNLSNRTAQSSFDARNTKAVSGASNVGQRQGGFREVIEDKQKRREQERKEIESMSKQEKVKAEKAKLDKQKIQDQRKDMSENINGEMTEINKAINKRNQLRNKLSEAQANGNTQLQKQLIDQFKDLNKQIKQKTKGVESLDDLEKRRDTLQQRKQRVEDAFKQQEEALNKVVNAGKKRGEAFVETMLNQQSVLNKIHGPKPGSMSETTQTRANINFSLDNISDVRDGDIKRRISKMLDDMT